MAAGESPEACRSKVSSQHNENQTSEAKNLQQEPKQPEQQHQPRLHQLREQPQKPGQRGSSRELRESESRGQQPEPVLQETCSVDHAKLVNDPNQS